MLTTQPISTTPVPFLANTMRWTRSSSGSGRQRVEFVAQLEGPTASFLVSESAYPVPAGKRLVIEEIWGTVRAGDSSGVEARLIVANGASPTSHVLPLSAPVMKNGGTEYTVALRARVYAEGRSSVAFCLARTSARATWSGSFTVSGYLADL